MNESINKYYSRVMAIKQIAQENFYTKLFRVYFGKGEKIYSSYSSTWFVFYKFNISSSYSIQFTDWFNPNMTQSKVSSFTPLKSYIPYRWGGFGKYLGWGPQKIELVPIAIIKSPSRLHNFNEKNVALWWVFLI